MEHQLSNDAKSSIEFFCRDYKKYGGKEKALKRVVMLSKLCCSNPDVASAFVEYANNYMKKMGAA